MAPIKPSIPFCLSISLKLQTHSFTSFIVLAYHRIKVHCCSLVCMSLERVYFQFYVFIKRYTAGLVGLSSCLLLEHLEKS